MNGAWRSEMTTQTETTDVAVVGAGPTGLTVAARLAQLGCRTW